MGTQTIDFVKVARIISAFTPQNAYKRHISRKDKGCLDSENAEICGEIRRFINVPAAPPIKGLYLSYNT
jgi:hypothetical protein